MFTYNNDSRDFRKTSKEERSALLKDWIEGMEEGRISPNKQWDELEFAIIETLMKSDEEVYKSFNTLLSAMK